ncbi:excinuclease ATPase subunit [Scleromatobacter humisilvae]|uniref:Excinuclease ATPase subunit n=1 Tax=Scleromatobacter humisilvae TaxID=2897159 RepID=A0A9X1YET8_9BURK|nr:excinuclease ATPase subunit [Scleromatobacter humisilvae]MCK9684282.1 excinuclease ATPase subunit [Scleromatobacter humisilvae]
MKRIFVAALAAATLAMPAIARNDVVTVTLQSVLDMPEAKERLDGVRFYLAGGPSPKVLKKLGTDTGNARTNAFNKTPEEACRWNALTALIKFREHAQRQNANAVVDIVSVRDHVEFKSPTDIECSDGTFAAGITLRGTYANVK